MTTNAEIRKEKKLVMVLNAIVNSFSPIQSYNEDIPALEINLNDDSNFSNRDAVVVSFDLPYVEGEEFLKILSRSLFSNRLRSLIALSDS